MLNITPKNSLKHTKLKDLIKDVNKVGNTSKIKADSVVKAKGNG